MSLYFTNINKSNVKTLITPISGEGMVLNLRPDEISHGRA